MPEGWRFEENCWVDGEGRVVEGEIEFEVSQYGSLEGVDFRLITTSSILSMLGSLMHLA
jgi:hypothetical protein